MTEKYPRVLEVEKRSKNNSAKCKCGDIAKFRSHIAFNEMRGDDDVIWACNDHKRDLVFLVKSSINLW